LNKLEIYLLSLLKKHRTYIFLVKLKLDLKVKILDIDSVLNIRDKFLTITIMQEQTLNCTRKANASNFDNQRVTKNSNIFSSKFY